MNKQFEYLESYKKLITEWNNLVNEEEDEAAKAKCECGKANKKCTCGKEGCSECGGMVAEDGEAKPVELQDALDQIGKKVDDMQLGDAIYTSFAGDENSGAGEVRQCTMKIGDDLFIVFDPDEGNAVLGETTYTKEKLIDMLKTNWESQGDNKEGASIPEFALMDVEFSFNI